MPRRVTYSDSFSGEADRELRALIDDDDDEKTADFRKNLKKVMLNVIKNELTTRQKEIIMLYYFKKKNIPEISEQLGVSPQAVSAAMKRARLRIFRYMQYYLP